jgi:tetratricopeptide (TPR) repeat protein
MTTNQETKELFSEGMKAFVNANYEKSTELLSKVLEHEPDHKLALIGRGSANLKLERLNEARADFDHAVAIDENYARAFHLRGLVLEKLGDDALAMADFNRAVGLNPEYAVAYYSRSALHAKMSNEDEALADMQMATHLGSVNLETYMNASNIWHSQHMRIEDAMETDLAR